jgi:DNA-binding CsgD family transcriptional regulator
MRSTNRRTTGPRRPEDLTVRERQILELIWKGLMNREIAMRLKIGTKTVEAHRASMMKRFESAIQRNYLRRRLDRSSFPLSLSESQSNPKTYATRQRDIAFVGCIHGLSEWLR